MKYGLNPKQKLALNSLFDRIDTRVVLLSIRGATTKEPLPYSKRESGTLKSYQIGDQWGELFDCAWFNLQCKIPLEFLGKDMYLKLDFNCELCLFNSEGLPIKGFTNKSSGFDKKLGMPTKRYFQVNEYIQPDGTLDLWIDAGLNDLFGEIKKGGKIECAEVVERNEVLRTLYYDLETLLPLYPKQAGQALKLATKDNQVDKALEITSSLLKQNTHNNHLISSIGHSHIDLAWLWPIRETKRKAARTFANVLYLMERYPDFKFGASQPQCYQWVKEDYPQLYEKIRAKIEEGRWEVQGGMWVESDTNVPNGESLVRQMLYGIRYFQQEFGLRVKSLWLPDVFGYNGNLPQIIKKSGLDYFMTIKLSWNRTNQFPHHTFNWKGIDGTGVLAHMPPEGTYNSPINVKFAHQSEANYLEKKISHHTLNLFGIGDGGGGPGCEHLERLARLRNLDPMPKVKQEFSSIFFDEIAQEQTKFPSYQGELYLEHHRGTYTSQARNKYYNRKLEQKLKTIETMLVHLGMDVHAQFKSKLAEIWKELLLYQFHDILPGSSIKRVYDECLDAYARLDQTLDRILQDALGTPLLNPGVDLGSITVSQLSIGEKISLYNPLPLAVHTWRMLKGGILEMAAAPLSDQTITFNLHNCALAEDTALLENSLLKLTFNPDGSISSVYDKTLQREILRKPANVIRVYRDSGNAWNLLPHYWWIKSEKPQLVARRYFKNESVGYLEQQYKYGHSTITQKIFLHPEQKLIEFDTEVDWHESRKMLRTAFPLNIKSKQAYFNIQFGYLTRSTENKTKLEKARWEVPAQKWVDINNGSFGSAVICDSKYGYRVKKNTIDLNLLRGTVTPGKEGDIAQHRFRYAFYVHEGDHVQGEVESHATIFDTWFPLYTGSKLPESFLTLSNPAIQYSTLKTAEDDDDSIILRLYETSGVSGACQIDLARLGVCSVEETNLVEENGVQVGKGSVISLNFDPFEIKTLKISPS